MTNGTHHPGLDQVLHASRRAAVELQLLSVGMEKAFRRQHEVSRMWIPYSFTPPRQQPPGA